MIAMESRPAKPLLEVTEAGLYCPAGDFHVDPSRRVPRAVITHAHSDHARPGSHAYLTSETGARVLRRRLGPEARIESAQFGQRIVMNSVIVSLHPAGHLLGSAQVRVEHRGEVWVVSGDYKTERDATCEPFEPVRCHTFITEATFALPVYRWRPQAEIFADINAWWRSNQEQGRTSILMGYSLGKAQRLLAGVDAGIGPIYVHRQVAEYIPAYVESGIRLPPTLPIDPDALRAAGGRALVIAPPAARPFETAGLLPTSTAFASGWMQLQSGWRRHRMDRGFVLSDHADWPGLLETIQATGAESIAATHGQTGVLVRYLREQGKNAWRLSGH
jgi:putative mRNA 3-end processing factor